jgi:hypothetical protein
MGEPLPFLEIEHDTGVVVEERMVAVERAGILCQWKEQPPQRRPGLAVHRVRVRGRHDIRSGGVHLRVDGEGGQVHRPVAVDHLTSVVDQDEVLHADHLEVHAERIDPEVVEELGVAGGDVTGNALVEPEMPEEAKGGGEALFAVPALVLGVVECGERHRESVGGHAIILKGGHSRDNERGLRRAILRPDGSTAA